MDVSARLDELRCLKDGWLEGKGITPSPEGLDWLSNAFNVRYPEDLPLPFVYPTAEGGIRAEWSVNRFEASLVIDLSRKAGEWHKLEINTSNEEADSVKLESDEDWKSFAARVRKLEGVG